MNQYLFHTKLTPSGIRSMPYRIRYWHLFVFFLVVRIPYLIVYYPGLMIFDSASSIAQFYGIMTHTASMSATAELILTDHHMVLFTLLMGGFIRIGELLSSQNFGMFLYILIQVIVSNLVITYCLFVFRGYLRTGMTLFSIAFYALIPHLSVYQIVMCKDSFFTIVLLFFCCCVYQAISAGFDMRPGKLGILLLTALLQCFSKHQGAYYLLLFGLVLLFGYKKTALRVSACFLALSIFYLTVYSSILLPAFGISKVGKQESMGFMFQQTARYVVDYGEELTREEQEAIDRVLPCEQLRELYNPTIQDDVKFTYKQSASSDDRLHYFQVWFSMFFKHPDSYIHATLDTIGGYFTDFSGKMKFTRGGIHGISIIADNPELTLCSTTPYELRSSVNDTLNRIGDIPVISILYRYPYYTWSTVLCLIILLVKERKLFVTFFLIFLTILLLILSPDVEYRYFLPVLYAWPVLLGITVHTARGQGNRSPVPRRRPRQHKSTTA